ncbi:NUDIX hydrolase [Cellulomonas marina]|uniref:8-oxo-dGTP diphosphatase n=1 Tax=Cellulomonas marina TaxID=988821 RepID=A0A1I0XET1_9CELL|nr:NUDIX hydrolase [Cellulomonas marina]GIG29867.1 ADP-ribose pyrophosphatase [Cellulomonas marina]SFA99579.1 8-oxo-dGTP diphosphatase [Cellulomonas marina]
MSGRRAPDVVAAGALVWRERRTRGDAPADHRVELLLVHRPRYDDWSWPKGKLEPGEALPVTARREVAEEGGVEVVLGQPLPTLTYRLADGRLKQVHYWAGRPAAPTTPAVVAREPVAPAEPTEIDRTRWFRADEARRRLTRAADREPLDALLHALERGRLATHAVVVARHGRARKRASWDGTEGDRPLTDSGRRQARALVPLLAAYGTERVVTSEWDRCWSTVTPYARAAHVPVVVEPVLTESAHESSPARVAGLVQGLLAEPVPAVLCTHRPVLPTVVDVLAQHTRRAVAAWLPASDPFLRPGELLVVHVAATAKGPRVVAAERWPTA